MCAAQALPQMAAAGASWGWDHEYVASAMALDDGYPGTQNLGKWLLTSWKVVVNSDK
jgi:hypothetical protein